jgi:hypothetical protein
MLEGVAKWQYYDEGGNPISQDEEDEDEDEDEEKQARCVILLSSSITYML